MSTAENNPVIDIFETVPAMVKVKIGKRTRKFADTTEGRAEAVAALDKFNNPAKAGNTGIMAVRKAAIALKAKVMAPILAYTATLEDYTDKAKAQRANVLYAICTEFPPCYFIITGVELPTPENCEGGTEGAVEISSENGAEEAVSEEIVDPLAELDGLDA